MKIGNEELWHKRLGHFYHARTMYIQRHNLVIGVSWLENRLTNYAACQFGKKARKPFPQSV